MRLCRALTILLVLVPLAVSGQESDPRQAAVRAFRGGDLRGAEAGCLSWLRDHPKDAEMTQLLGMARLRAALAAGAAGRPPSETTPALRRARQDLLHAEALAPGRTLPDLSQAIGYALLAEGRPRAALERLTRGIGENPDRPLGYALRGRAQIELGAFAEAASDFSSALRLDPSDLETQLLHADALSRAGRTADALAALQAFEHTLPPRAPRHAEVLREIGAYARDLGQDEQARSALRSSLDLDPEQPRVLLDLGLLDYREGRLEAARDRLDEVLARPSLPGDVKVEALQTRGLVAQHLGRYADAARDFRAALDLQPNRAETLQTYAAALMHLGRAAEAKRVAARFARVARVESRIRRLQDRLGLVPTDRTSRVELIRRLLDLGRVAEARRQLSELRQRDPDDPALADLVARIRRAR